MERQKWDLTRTQELLRELIGVFKKSTESGALFHDHLITESGEFIPSLKKASAQTVPKMKLLQEQRVLLAVSPFPQKLMEKIELLKDDGVQGIDRYIWLVGQIIADPDVRKLVSVQPGSEPSVSSHSANALLEGVRSSPKPPGPAEMRLSGNWKVGAAAEMPEAGTRQIQDLTLDDRNGNTRQPLWSSRTTHRNKALGVPKPLIEGVSYPGTPLWDLDRPYLTGKHIYQQDSIIQTRRNSLGRDAISNAEPTRSLGGYSPAVQELLVLDNLLFMMVGIEGNYLWVRRGRAKENPLSLAVDPTMDSSLQDLAKRVLPLCENYLTVSQFAESRTHFQYGLVNHAFAAALRAILQDYYAMVAQLEHQFRLSRLSLQGLWFFCQPMMGVMQALSAVVQKAVVRSLTGAAILNLLQSQAKAMAGDSAGTALLQKLTQAASVPYFGILERWVSEGVIDDPYGEFLIEENKALQKESLSQDYHATYWHQRYSLGQDVPGFLSGFAETILTAGKYLNAVRECGWSLKIPFLNDAHGTVAGTARPYLERINVAYNHASAELVNLIVNKCDLMGRLRSVKHYFFMDQGDFLVHFLDIAQDELLKRSSTITMEKLQSLLELALRTSVSASDPYYEDLICNVEKTTLLSQLQTAITFGVGNTESNGIPEPFVVNWNLNESSLGNAGAAANITGIETFTLDYKVRWPVSLVISRKALTKHQLIFRHLFHFKHVERQLCMTWQAHQATRHLSFVGTAITWSYVLCQRMLHFLQSIEHYMTFEVLEPNWHIMETKIQNAKSVDEIIQQHDIFLDKCLQECMLLWPSILKKVESLKSICQQYALTTQWLIPSMNTPAKWGFSKDPTVNGDTKTKGNAKFKQRSKYQPLRGWKADDETDFKTTLGRIDEEFRTQLKDLTTLLSTCSQQEPCFAHLAQALQGDEQAKHSYHN